MILELQQSQIIVILNWKKTRYKIIKKYNMSVSQSVSQSAVGQLVVWIQNHLYHGYGMVMEGRSAVRYLTRHERLHDASWNRS